MPPAGFNYGLMMQSALRSMIVDILSQVAARGLPGRHHFFITFDTMHPGVDIADWLKKRYPSEMTIVIQEWFADLAVAGDRFSVTLNFGDQPERLVVPLDAIKTFVDPSVEFGLRFDPHDGPGGDDDGPDKPARPVSDPPRHPSTAADVVRLDRFRRH